MKKNRTFLICLIGVMSALSTVIYLIFPEIPLVPGVDYLKIDFSDIPAVISAVLCGPFAGICVEIIKNVIHLFRTTTLGIGELMNIGIGSAMIGSLYFSLKHFSKKLKNHFFSPNVYYLSAVIAVIVTVIAGWLLNGLLTPVFFALSGIPITAASIIAGVTGSTLLNAVKAAVNLLVFYPVYFAIYKAVPNKNGIDNKK